MHSAVPDDGERWVKNWESGSPSRTICSSVTLCIALLFFMTRVLSFLPSKYNERKEFSLPSIIASLPLHRTLLTLFLSITRDSFCPIPTSFKIADAIAAPALSDILYRSNVSANLCKFKFLLRCDVVDTFKSDAWLTIGIISASDSVSELKSNVSYNSFHK